MTQLWVAVRPQRGRVFLCGSDSKQYSLILTGPFACNDSLVGIDSQYINARLMPNCLADVFAAVFYRPRPPNAETVQDSDNHSRRLSRR
jgi:hypothetical protein